MFSYKLHNPRKRNPYVGFNRDTSDALPNRFYPASTKTNPYLGIFRHAPSVFANGRKRLRCGERVPATRKERMIQHGDSGGIKIINALDISRLRSCLGCSHCDCEIGGGGRLPGGVNNELFRTSTISNVYPPMTWLDGRISGSVASATLTSTASGMHSLYRSSLVSGKAQMNCNSQFSLHSLILRLPSLFRGNWLFGDVEDGGSPEWNDSDPQLHIDDEEYEYSDCDDFSTKSISSCCKRANQCSSVVEDCRIGVEALQDFLDGCASYDGGERMDYVITQTDIARMARCASKHLESPPPKMVTIKTEEVALPHAKESDLRGNETTPDGMWSWMMISSDGQAAVLSEQWDGQDEAFEHHEDCCVICLEIFSDGEKLRVLPCNHYFHTGCIDHWLLGTYSDYECVTSGCPMCKKRATTLAEEVISAIGSVPSWAFARLGGALAKESFHQTMEQTAIPLKEDGSLPSSVSSV